MCTHTHAHSHTHMHACTHTHTHTHTRTHTHTNKSSLFFLNDFFNRRQDVPLHCTFFNMIMYASKHSFNLSVTFILCIRSHLLKFVCDFPLFFFLLFKTTTTTLAQYIQSCLWVIRKVQVFPTSSLFSLQQHPANCPFFLSFSFSKHHVSSLTAHFGYS